MTNRYTIYDGADIVAKAAAAIEHILRQALTIRGSASLMVSGGSSPRPLYEHLSTVDLDWSKITVSLVDERWVNQGEAGSNEDFIRATLLKNRASAATFFGLKTDHETAEAGLSTAEARFNTLDQPFDICVMGMGSDAHTASWFPHAKGLETALLHSNQNTLCNIDAAGAPVAGDHPHRISLTLSAVLASHAIFLFIPGEAKRTVFDTAPSKPVIEAPVKALLDAGQNLHVFASPAL